MNRSNSSSSSRAHLRVVLLFFLVFRWAPARVVLPVGPMGLIVLLVSWAVHWVAGRVLLSWLVVLLVVLCRWLVVVLLRLVVAVHGVSWGVVVLRCLVVGGRQHGLVGRPCY